MKLSNDPKKFFESVPTNLYENLEFRKELHVLLNSDVGFQQVFKAMMLEYPPIFFNCIAWTFNPRKIIGERNQPFILRPKQIKAVEAIDSWYKAGKEGVIDKSRDEGATELITKFLALQWLISPEFQALMGSRKEELVDSRTQWVNNRVLGDPSCLFHKVLYALNYCPSWLRPKQHEYDKTYLMLQNLKTGAVIKGESTNENFGAGARHSIAFVDEVGRVDYRLAQGIIETLGPVSDCVLYCSTHFYGVAHPYNGLLTGKFGDKKLLVLGWEDNPEKNEGLYRSPSPGELQIKDINSYRLLCPEIFDNIEEMETITIDDFSDDLSKYDLSFIADGGDSNEGGWRSFWYDEYCRNHSPRDVAQNVDRRPIGAGDIFFSPGTLRRMEIEHCFPAKFHGDFELDIDNKGKVTGALFIPASSGRFEWWGDLHNGRPSQKRNYVFTADISRGTGASNSTLGIYDTTSHEKLGSYVNPFLSPEKFADLVTGIWHWAGGGSRPYIIWEAQGPGDLFGPRLVWQGIGPLYEDRDKTKFTKPRKRRWGWQSSDNRKRNALLALDSALTAGVSGVKTQQHLIIHDVQAIREYETYIELPGGGIGPAHSISDSSGARQSHGDRVINDMLFIEAVEYQPPIEVTNKRSFPVNSAGARLKQRQRQTQLNKLNKRFLF